MFNSNIPSDRELPSTGRLIKSTILAAITAVILLVTMVMPAEYGMDPTGVGERLGLKEMGEIKTTLAEEAAADAARTETAIVEATVEKAPEPQAPSKTVTMQTHEMEITLAPGEGTEVKVTMLKGDEVSYSWQTSGGRAKFDVHGDSEELKIEYHSYSKGSGQRSKGVIEAAFDGNHGWFWRNRTDDVMVITLKTDGKYSDIKQLK